MNSTVVLDIRPFVTSCITASRSEIDELREEIECFRTRQAHAIVCGSLRVVDNDTIVVGDALMRRTRENIDRCPNVEFLVWHRKDAYSIKAKFRVRLDTGPLYDSMVKDLEKINLWPSSVCIFDTTEVWDESASHTAGDRVVRWTSKGGARSPRSRC